MHAKLIVMRHGESTWTQKSVNRFAGWVNVPLTTRGRDRAVQAGRLLSQAGLAPDMVFTSLLSRAILTSDIVLDLTDRSWIPVERTWRLNERHYGAFQGETRPAMLKRYGQDRFNAYRRSFDGGLLTSTRLPLTFRKTTRGMLLPCRTIWTRSSRPKSEPSL